MGVLVTEAQHPPSSDHYILIRTRTRWKRLQAIERWARGAGRPSEDLMVVGELWLKANPVAISRGAPVFADLEDLAKLELPSARGFPSGIGRDHPPLRRCPGIRSRRQHRLVHAVLRATPGHACRGSDPLGGRRARHALHRAERGAGRITFAVAGLLERLGVQRVPMGTGSRLPSRPTPRARQLARPEPGLRHRQKTGKGDSNDRNRSLHLAVARRVHRRAQGSRGRTDLRRAALGRADRAPTKEVRPMSITTVLAAVPDTERRRAAVLAA